MVGYRASLDRAGHALAAGGMLGGLIAAGLVAIGSGPAPFALLAGFVIGAALTPVLAVAIGGPLWLVCRAIGWRGPLAAVVAGALAGFAMFLGGQTYGFGLFAMPPSDGQTLLSAGSAVGVVLALAGSL